MAEFPTSCWYIAAEARELKQRPLARQVAGQHLVLFRDAQGQAAALFDRCPHRNVQLSRGKVRQGCIECPYHGFRFQADGACAHVPSLQTHEKIPSALRAQPFPVREQQGYLWVWVGDRPPEADEQPFVLPHHGEPGWGHGYLQSTIGNSVANLIENFIDCPHTGYIHGGLFRSPASHLARTHVQAVADGVIIDIDEDNKTNSFLGRLIVPKGSQVTHQDRYIYPSTVQVAYGFGPKRQVTGYQICTPVTADRTQVYVYVTWKLGWLNPFVAPLVQVFGKIILDQDVAILENQGEMLRAYGEKFSSVPADTANLWIQATRQRLQRGETPPERDKNVDFRL